MRDAWLVVGAAAGFLCLTACSASISCDPNSSDYAECSSFRSGLKQAEDQAARELQRQAETQARQAADQLRAEAEAQARQTAEEARRRAQQAAGDLFRQLPMVGSANPSGQPFRCPGAAFQFPLINGNLGWLYMDERSNGVDPSGDHTGVDVFPPVQDDAADVYPLADGVLKEVNRANHSFEIYYPAQRVTSYMAHVDLKPGLANESSVPASQPLGRLFLQRRNTHLHFSLRETGPWSHYNDQQAPTSRIYPGPMLAQDPSPWFNAKLRDADGLLTPLQSEYPYYRAAYRDFCG